MSETQKYKINPEKSQLIVETQAGGFLGKMGHDLEITVREFSGEILLNSEDLSRSSVKVTLQASSLEVLNVESEKDLKEIEENLFGKVLAIQSFPRISFESHRLRINSLPSNCYSVWVEGTFTLRDIMKNIETSGALSLTGNELKVEGTFEIKQTDFGIKPFSTLGGAIRVKDKVKITYSLVACS